MKGALKLIIATVLAAGLLCPSVSTAQEDTQTDGTAGGGLDLGSKKVEAKGVGIAGGAIVGAELVAAVEALIGVDSGWAYVVFPLIGAGGGAAGGYFMRKASPEGAVGLLVGGMALIIPTALLVTSAMSFSDKQTGTIEDEPVEDSYSFEMTPTTEGQMETSTTEVETRPDEGGGEEPPPEPEAPAAEPEAAPEPEASRTQGSPVTPHAAAGSLFHVDRNGSAGMALPSVQLRPTSISAEEALYGVRPGLEVHIPLLRIDLP